MNSFSTENLADLIDKRHRCLVQLRDLGHKQAELIHAGEMGPLLRLITAKNQLIAALQSIEQALAPFHEQDPDQRNWHSGEAKAQSSRLAGACQSLLQEVMELERENEQNMIERRDKVASQLQAAQAANSARGAYQAHQRSPAQGPHQAQHSPVVPLESNQHGQQLDLQSDV